MLKVAGGGGISGGVVYSGTWDANTNTPTLTSGIGTKGNYYVVSVPGNTNLDGITDWQVGDWAIFNGVVWQKVDNSEVTYVSNVATGTGLTGGPITTTGTISIANTGVTAGVYGNANSVPQVTINAQGQTTNVTNVAIAIDVANVTNAVPVTREIIAGTGLTGGGNLSSNVTISLANTANISNLTVDYIDFNTNANVTVTESLLTWNNTAGTLSFGVQGGLPLNIGFENLVKVYNNTGSPLTKGQVVSVTGAQGQVPTVALSNASSEALSRDTLGIVQDNSISNGGEGFVCTFGVVNNIKTYGTVAGDPIYLSNVAGQFTSTEPTQPDHIVALGWVVRVSNTPTSTDGQIFVTINNGWELNELHNVLISNVANNDYLVYSNTSNLWVNLSPPQLVAGTGLANGGSLIANTNVTIALANTNVAAGVYGDSTHVAQFTVDAQGRLTNASNVAIGGSPTVVTNVATVTNGTLVSWQNNAPATITWQNNSLATIGWTNNIYLVTANNATILVNCSSEALTTQLPAAGSVSGQQFKIKKIDSTANAATVSTTSAQTIDGSTTYNLASQYYSVTVQSDGSNWWVTAEVV